MPFIQRSEAERLFKPYFGDFKYVVMSSWRDWIDGPYASQMQHKTVRANCIWNQLVIHAKRRFEGIPTAYVEKRKTWFGVLIENTAFVRMKKGSQELLSRNYPTLTALAFHDTQQDLFNGIARIELLYVLDKDETDIERIVLVQRHNRSIAWFIDILEQGSSAAQSVIALVPLQPSGTPASRIIKPKEGIKEDDKLEPKLGS